MTSSFQIPLNGYFDEIDGSSKKIRNLDDSEATKHETPTKDAISLVGVSQSSPSPMQKDPSTGGFLNGT